jgi:hypothetical protein
MMKRPAGARLNADGGGLQSIFCRSTRKKVTESPQIAKKKLECLSVPVHQFPAIHKIAMKSKKNLTRFTYETAAFEGWRLCISRAGTTFTKYFPDKKFGGGKKSLAAAEAVLVELKALIEGAKRVEGKLSPATIKKAEKMLAEA